MPADACAILAERLLDLADELQQAELNIKKHLLEAAECGDLWRVSHVIRRWLEMPVAEVLAEPPNPSRKQDAREKASAAAEAMGKGKE